MTERPTEPPQGERRAHPRHPASLPARITLIGYTVEGRLEDIGVGGVRFTTDDEHLQVEPGNFVRIAFDCRKGDGTLTVERAVRVTWVQPPSDGSTSRSLGMAFDEPVDLAGLSFDA